MKRNVRVEGNCLVVELEVIIYPAPEPPQSELSDSVCSMIQMLALEPFKRF